MGETMGEPVLPDADQEMEKQADNCANREKQQCRNGLSHHEDSLPPDRLSRKHFFELAIDPATS